MENAVKEKRTLKKVEKEVIPDQPVRKSRRLQGVAPEIILDEFRYLERKPQAHSVPLEDNIDKEKEGKIVFLFFSYSMKSYDGNFDASELSTQGNVDAFFESLKKASPSDSSEGFVSISFSPSGGYIEMDL